MRLPVRGGIRDRKPLHFSAHRGPFLLFALERGMSDDGWEPAKGKTSSSIGNPCAYLLLNQNITSRAGSTGSFSSNISLSFQDHCTPP